MGKLKWTLDDAPANNDWQGIAYGNGLFVAVAESGTNRIMTSNDGLSWTARPAPVNKYWNGIAYGNGKFVVVGLGGSPWTMSSTDGINWTTGSVVGYTGNGFYNVAYGDGKFVAVSSEGIIVSTDGENWTTTRKVTQDSYWRDVAYGNGLFVVVANYGIYRIITSPDGITWTERHDEVDSFFSNIYNWKGITYGNGLFVVINGNMGTGYNSIITSPDGINWTVVFEEANNIWQSVAYGDGLFVISGYNKTLVSTNGVNWHREFLAEDSLFTSNICYGDEKFVVISAYGYGKIATANWPAPYNFDYGNGAEENPYEIWTPEDLDGVRDYLEDTSIHFIQKVNIDLSGFTNWVPIGDATGSGHFSGFYDGNNFIVSNLTMIYSSFRAIGLFGSILDGSVSNLGIENININSSGTIVGAGGLAGAFHSDNRSLYKISNCYCKGTVIAENNAGLLIGIVTGPVINCWSEGTARGITYKYANAGGLVGKITSGEIHKCYSLANVEGVEVGGLIGSASPGAAIENCYAMGNVTGTRFAGGLIGNSYSPYLANCYSKGFVSLTPLVINNIGGLIGMNDSSMIVTPCYYDSDASGQSDIGKGEPKTTAEMKQQSTYENWDFDTIWDIDGVTNDGYPFLRGFSEELEEPDIPSDTTILFYDDCSSLDNWTIENNYGEIKTDGDCFYSEQEKYSTKYIGRGNMSQNINISSFNLIGNETEIELALKLPLSSAYGEELDLYLDISFYDSEENEIGYIDFEVYSLYPNVAEGRISYRGTLETFVPSSSLFTEGCIYKIKFYEKRIKVYENDSLILDYDSSNVNFIEKASSIRFYSSLDSQTNTAIQKTPAICDIKIESKKAPPLSHGRGTEDNPYQIWTAEDLNEIRNHSEGEFYFNQMADIDLEEYSDWTPIGYDMGYGEFYFEGHYKGNFYAIKNMKISSGYVPDIPDPSIYRFVGLFGNCPGTIEGIRLVDYDINILPCYMAFGAPISFGSMKVSKCSAEGNVSIKNANNIMFSGLSTNHDEGEIEDSFAICNASITAASGGFSMIAGISGGDIETKIANCYAVLDMGDSVISHIYGTGPGIEDFQPSNYYNSELVTPTEENDGVPKTTVEMKLQETYEDWNFDTIWDIDPGINEGYPFLRGIKKPKYQFAHGDGTGENPYEIWTHKDLAGMYDYRLSLDEYAVLESSNIYFKQMADIDLSNYNNWAIYSMDMESFFSINYHGNGFEIKNMKMNLTEEVGYTSFFGITAPSSVLKGINLKDYTINCSGNLEETFHISVITTFYGKIENCSAKGIINFDGIEAGIIYGLAFYSIAMNNCYSFCKINTTNVPEDSDYSAIGIAEASLDIHGDPIPLENCYSVLQINGEGNFEIKGVCGGTTFASYYNSDFITPEVEVEYGGIPKTTVEMKQQSTYENWDFNDVWNINPTINDGYPYLRTEKIDIDIPTSPILELLKDIELLSHRTHLYISEEQKINLATKYGIGSLVVASGIYPETLIELDSLVNSYWEHTTKDIKLKWKQILYTNINGYIKLDNIIINDMFNYLTNEELIIGDLIQLQDNLIIPIPPLPVIEWTPSWMDDLYEELKETDDETIINDGLVEWDWYVTMDDELYKVLKNNPSLDETDEFLEASDVLSLIKKINNAIKPMN